MANLCGPVVVNSDSLRFCIGPLKFSCLTINIFHSLVSILENDNSVNNRKWSLSNKVVKGMNLLIHPAVTDVILQDIFLK